MSRPRKPTASLELSGAFRHDPQRRRPTEPKDLRDLGDPPGRLPANVIPYWNEIAEMVQGGVLTFRDRWAVELAAGLMYKAVGDKPDSISSAELSTLRSLLAALGMTPADRSKLSVPTEKPKNAFSDLAAAAQSLRAN